MYHSEHRCNPIKAINKITKQETRRSPNKELKIYEIQNKEKTYKISNNDNTSSRNILKGIKLTNNYDYLFEYID